MGASVPCRLQSNRGRHRCWCPRSDRLCEPSRCSYGPVRYDWPRWHWPPSAAPRTPNTKHITLCAMALALCLVGSLDPAWVDRCRQLFSAQAHDVHVDAAVRPAGHGCIELPKSSQGRCWQTVTAAGIGIVLDPLFIAAARTSTTSRLFVVEPPHLWGLSRCGASASRWPRLLRYAPTQRGLF